MRNIIIEQSEKWIEQRNVEIVERKGIGHPDYICDACCEAASQALSAHYLKNFGSILHHNLDKGLLIAGKSAPKFGGGRIVEPIKMIIAGRATDSISGKTIPVEQVIREAVQNWLRGLGIASDNHFKISIEYEPGAVNLQEVFTRQNKKVPIANDTSFGVAHAPLSRTEKICFDVANLINSKDFVKRFPAVGRDIKVMALRKNRDIALTIAIAFIDRHVSGVKEYFEIKEKVKKDIYGHVKKLKAAAEFDSVKIDINALDDPNAKSEQDIYLTVTGLSAEQGDDGQVGRGNRPCGLITPCREMSMEAAAGKNINHPGKLYQAMALIIAQEIAKIKGVKDCEVKMLSEIGTPLDQPQAIDVRLIADNFEQAKKESAEIINKILDNLPQLQLEIAAGKYTLY